jgi:hypothetical protein
LGFAYYIIKKITSMQILRRKKSIAIFKLRYYFKRYVDSKRKKDLLPFFIGFLTYVRSSRILTWLVFGLSIRYDNGFTAILFLHIYQFEDRYNDNLLGRARRINNDNGHHIREYNNSNPFATPQEPEPFQQPDRVLFPGSLMWWGSMSATPFLGRFARVLIRTVPRNPGGPNANNGSPNAND